jgi:hypothetical protein
MPQCRSDKKQLLPQQMKFWLLLLVLTSHQLWGKIGQLGGWLITRNSKLKRKVN